MTDRATLEYRANLIMVAAGVVADLIEGVEKDYGPTFRRNGGHLAILDQAKERLKRKPGRKPKASEVPA